MCWANIRTDLEQEAPVHFAQAPAIFDEEDLRLGDAHGADGVVDLVAELPRFGRRRLRLLEQRHRLGVVVGEEVVEHAHGRLEFRRDLVEAPVLLAELLVDQKTFVVVVPLKSTSKLAHDSHFFFKLSKTQHNSTLGVYRRSLLLSY